MTPMPDRCDAVVIGAGLGGLALAIRLQAAGRRVVLVEARDKPGGRAYVWHDKGHVFDAGPTVITDPAALAELWSLSGHRIGDDVQLVPVEPFYRLVFPDGSTFEYADDQARIEAAVRAINPADVEGYRRFLAYSREVMAEGYDKLGTAPFQSFSDMMRVAPQLVRLQAYRSVYAVVSRFIADPRLRQAFSFHSLLVGGNPFTTSSIYLLIHALERKGGVWFAKGGTNALVAGMARHFQRLGGHLELNARVARIEAALSRGAHYVLLLDDDSKIANADILAPHRRYLQLTAEGIKVGAVGTAVLDADSLENIVHKLDPDKPYTEIRDLMSSGTLIPAEVLRSIGLMREDLFIDCVDFEWGWRCRQSGMVLVVDNQVRIHHRLGQSVIQGAFGAFLRVPAPIRHYYQFRNVIALIMRGRSAPVAWRLRNALALLLKLPLYLLLLGARSERAAYIFSGIRDGFRNKMGKHAC